MKNPRTIRAWAVAFWLAIWQLGSVILNRDSLLPLLVLFRNHLYIIHLLLVLERNHHLIMPLQILVLMT